MSRSDPCPTPWYSSNLFIAGLLSVVTVAAYGHVWECDFVDLDDEMYVVKNPQVQSGLNTQSLWWALTTTESANWHPLTWISLQLDANLYGNKPAGYHLTSLFIHVANTLLLFVVLDRMTRERWRSALVAALFSLHPLHVESVAWVFERKDVLSALFWILTMGAYARYAEKPSYRSYLLVMLFFVLGLAAKPMVVTLPCVLLLLDYWPLVRAVRHEGRIAREKGSRPRATRGEKESPKTSPFLFVRRLFPEKVPLLALSAACCLITLYGQSESSAIKSDEEYPFPTRLANAVVGYLEYVGMLFWPAKLSVFYPYGRNLDMLRVAGAVVVLLAITVFVLFQRSRRYFFVGWFWYLGTLVPVVGIIQVGRQAMADRYTYIPSIGLFIAIVWGLTDLAAAVRMPRWARVVLAGTALAACGLLTRTQVEHWQNRWTLWESALRADPENYMAYRTLAANYQQQGNDDEAVRCYWRAIECNPYDTKSYTYLADVFRRKNQLEEMIEVLRKGLQFNPEEAEWRHNLGVALLDTGKPDEGVEELRSALRLKPGLAMTHLRLGQELAKRGQSAEAKRHFDEGYRLMPQMRPKTSE
jgi:tetratricopeptide (TPR) repeat protein